LSRKTEVLAATQREEFVILACVFLTQYRSVTDRQTDRRTPRRWLRRAKHSAVARNKPQANF